MTTTTDDIAVVSCADSGYFDLLQGMVCSIRDKPEGRRVKLYVLDIGLTPAQRTWLLVQGATVRGLEIHPFREGLAAHIAAFQARCRIPELFPGHAVYVWIDADAWVQCWDGIESYIAGARHSGFAISAEDDPAYDRSHVLASHRASFAMFGLESENSWPATGPLNAGIFAGCADAPHWDAWRQMIERHVTCADSTYEMFMLDQTALCIACAQAHLPLEVLPTRCNWLAHFALPMVSADGALLLRPTPPYEKIEVLHQTGDSKRALLPLRRIGGGAVVRHLSYQARSLLAANDYVSPGFTLITLDHCFPYMIRGDQSISDWPYIRRGLPHAWFVDRRMPSWGFLNRDEAHILYNLAIRFSGGSALEIGCLAGWSACHLAAAGLDLDVIDPLLSEPQVAASVGASLQASHFPGRVTLIADRSPDAVHKLAQQRPDGWSLFFIDGDHEGEAPVNDVKACERYAAKNCAMAFHDLASPHVTNAVVYLQSRGWMIRVYHTAQIMAVAWRGNVEPPVHQPDPRIAWEIPEHVMPLLT